MAASRLLELLAIRHHRDIFVPECKTGPTQRAMQPCIRMDAWTMKRSWANPLTTAYEIKSSRQDFVQDEKWHLYLPYCNEFYFVAPSKIIDPQELPDEAGLLVASTNFGRLFCKKKAPRRQVEIPEELWRYVLMCRSKITRENDLRETTREWWQKWLERREVDRALGWRVSKSLREAIDTRINEVETENHNLQKQIEDLGEVREFLGRIGVSLSWCPTHEIEKKLKGCIPKELRWAIQTLDRGLSDLTASLDALENVVVAEGE